jgi:hypothetical protein
MEAKLNSQSILEFILNNYNKEEDVTKLFDLFKEDIDWNAVSRNLNIMDASNEFMCVHADNLNWAIVIYFQEKRIWYDSIKNDYDKYINSIPKIELKKVREMKLTAKQYFYESRLFNYKEE